ncbi:MAG: SOS response-associated peptidase [Gammaproteobacteria bacterium]|nr:MAG: SOS response-associated peptidase [Gammaproteobacteria bacterium]
MCGRFAFYSPREAVLETFGVDLGFDPPPRYNIAPSQDIVALRPGAAGERSGAWLRWGLVPSWAQDPAIGNRMINARAETVRSKPAFRAAFRRRRCVILADGFYEWQARNGAKQPWYISAADGRPLAMAGLWERWEGGEQRLESCTIITTEANRTLADLHGRMPVVLAPPQLDAWFGDSDLDRLETLLRPCPDDRLRCWPVSRRVNDPRHDGPELIRELQPDA